MRLDKWLKVSRVIKRRTVANEACNKGKIQINNKIAKASTEVNSGDILEISMGNRIKKLEVLEVRTGNVSTQSAKELYNIISDIKTEEDLFD